MSVIDAIIKANKEGRKVVWPGTKIPHDDHADSCTRCGIIEVLSWRELCEYCEDDMNTPWPSSAEAYIEAAQPVFPFKSNRARN